MSSKKSQFNKGRSDKAKGTYNPPKYGILEGFVDAMAGNFDGPKNNRVKQREYNAGQKFNEKKARGKQ